MTDYGPLNAAQQVQLNLLRPLLSWWLLHPGTVGDNGKLSSDFRWIHNKIEAGIKALVDLADKRPRGEIKTISEIIEESRGKTE